MKFPVVEFPELYPEVQATGDEEFGRPIFKLLKNFNCIINGNEFIIPAGILFDFASIPRPFWIVLPPNDPEYQAASLLHDVAYQGKLWVREMNDKLFLAAMKSAGVPEWKCNIMYFAVRTGGWVNYWSKKNMVKFLRTRKLLNVNLTDKPLWSTY